MEIEAAYNPTGHQPEPPHHQDTRTRNETRLNLTYNGEEQVLTKVPPRTEGNEDEGGGQVKQGALYKHGGDPVTQDSARAGSLSNLHHV